MQAMTPKLWITKSFRLKLRKWTHLAHLITVHRLDVALMSLKTALPMLCLLHNDKRTTGIMEPIIMSRLPPSAIRMKAFGLLAKKRRGPSQNLR
jgi:hypothetical protein